MSLTLESTFARLQAIHGGAGLRHLLGHLSSSCALKLRNLSRTLKSLDGIEEKAFQCIFVHTPPKRKQSVAVLGNIGPCCRHLVINIASLPGDRQVSPLRSKPTSTEQRFRRRSAAPKQAQENCSARLAGAQCIPLSSYPSESPVAWKFFVQRRPNDINQTLLKQWLYLFSLLPNIQELTIACNGDPAWPGCTDIEGLLIILRICIERTNPLHLRTVRLNPIHAMGIMHLRWAGPGTYGEAPASRNNVWQKLESLEMHITSPYTPDQLSRSQQQIFEKVLYDYLSSFSRTLVKLKFLWLEGEGINPLLPGSNLNVVKWYRLREFCVGGISDSDQVLAMMRASAPDLQKVTVLVPEPQNDSVVAPFEDSPIWKEILEALGHGSGASSLVQSPDDAGAYASDLSAVASSSSTIRSIPIMLDIR
ncbi:hypothetical protein MBLNU459_g4454t2 [Dothideomycetes sp. NU459]